MKVEFCIPLSGGRWLSRTIEDALPVVPGSFVIPFPDGKPLKILATTYDLDRRMMHAGLELDAFPFVVRALERAFLENGWVVKTQ